MDHGAVTDLEWSGRAICTAVSVPPPKSLIRFGIRLNNVGTNIFLKLSLDEFSKLSIVTAITDNGCRSIGIPLKND